MPFKDHQLTGSSECLTDTGWVTWLRLLAGADLTGEGGQWSALVLSILHLFLPLDKTLPTLSALCHRSLPPVMVVELTPPWVQLIVGRG